MMNVMMAGIAISPWAIYGKEGMVNTKYGKEVHSLEVVHLGFGLISAPLAGWRTRFFRDIDELGQLLGLMRQADCKGLMIG